MEKIAGEVNEEVSELKDMLAEGTSGSSGPLALLLWGPANPEQVCPAGG